VDLTNKFDVGAPIDQSWRVLTDLERIAPCLPGAQLLEVEGDEYRGVVKVKVGPAVAQYKGKVVFVERDDANHRAVLLADGRETRGQGNATARIEVNLARTATGTHVVVETNLQVSGRVAQFGRGVMADVSANLMTQFAENLKAAVRADDVQASDAPPAPAGPVVDGPPVMHEVEGPEATPLDLMDVVGAKTKAKLAIPIVVVIAVIML
jgi:carbon monoxide dehydrogenase subunit G